VGKLVTAFNNVLPTLGNMHVVKARRQYAGRYLTYGVHLLFIKMKR